jgi:hypothetical protein
MGLGLLELKDPGAVFELIAVMEFGIVRASIYPHFVDNLEPAVSQPSQGVGMALVLLAVMQLFFNGRRQRWLRSSQSVL